MRTIKRYPLTMTHASIVTNRYAELLSRGDNVTRANQPYYGVITKQSIFDALLEHSITNVKDEVTLRAKALEKWIFEQGGSFSNERIGTNIPLYATSVRTYRSRMNEIAKCIKRVFQDNGIMPKYTSWIIKDSRELFNTYKRTHKSSAGWTKCR